VSKEDVISSLLDPCMTAVILLVSSVWLAHS